jgi:hypothetical protein
MNISGRSSLRKLRNEKYTFSGMGTAITKRRSLSRDENPKTDWQDVLRLKSGMAVRPNAISLRWRSDG